MNPKTEPPRKEKFIKLLGDNTCNQNKEKT